MRLTAIFGLALVACADQADAASDEVLDTCIDPERAAQTPGVQLLDVRSPEAYAEAHPPGAVHLDASTLVRENGELTNELVDPATAKAAFEAAGVALDRPVVVMGEATDTSSARVAWTLAWLGHSNYALLDGGFPAWADAGLATSSAATTPVPGSFAPAVVDDYVVDAAWVLDHLDDPSVELIDVRTAEEFAEGHIPGARSIDWLSTVDAGAFLADIQLAARYVDVPRDATVVVYCQSGMRAAVGWIGLRTVGFTDVRLYDGSWAEWGARDDLPREP